LLALFAFGALAWSYRLDMYGALTSGSGPLYAFAYADNHVGIPVNLVLSFVTLAFGFMVAFAMWRDQRRTALVLVTGILLIPYLAIKAGPWLAEQFATERDATRRERPYQVIRALYTNQAFGADSAHMPDAPASLAIESPAELARDVSVWDPATIVQSLSRARRGASVFEAQAWRESPVGPIATAIERPVGGGRWMGIRVLASGEEPQGSVLRVDSLGRSDLSDLALPPALIQEGASGDTVIADSTGVVAAPRGSRRTSASCPRICPSATRASSGCATCASACAPSRRSSPSAPLSGRRSSATRCGGSSTSTRLPTTIP
jgi:hypothetical protein